MTEAPSPADDDTEDGGDAGEPTGAASETGTEDGAATAESTGEHEAGRGRSEDADTRTDPEALRREVEERYDFDEFGPADMREMSAEEWEAAFDPEAWVTGTDLLDRVQAELESRIASREVFATLERVSDDDGDRLVAYSDEGYAVVFADGSVEGRGTVRRDVEPTVALCSMPDYEVADPPESFELPDPESVTAGSGELGNTMLQVVAGFQMLAGLALFVAWLATDLSTVVAPVAAFGFVAVGAFLFLVVANARLSDRFRAEEYRRRLRAVSEEGDRPEFLPPGVLPEDEEAESAGEDA